MKGDRRVADVTHRVRIGPSSSLGPSHGMESLLSTQPVGRGTGPGTRGAPRDRDRRVHRARCGARRGPVGGAAQAGERAPNPRGDLRNEHARRRRHRLAGPPLWGEAAATQPRVHRRGRALAGARDRRQHGDLPVARRRAPAAVAGPTPRTGFSSRDLRLPAHSNCIRARSDEHSRERSAISRTAGRGEHPPGKEDM